MSTTLADAIAGLPKTKSGLLRKLRRMNVRRYAGEFRCTNCPVAQLLTKETGSLAGEVWVTSRSAHFTAQAKDRFHLVGGFPESFPIPPVVTEFINEYDRGKWPEFDAPET